MIRCQRTLQSFQRGKKSRENVSWIRISRYIIIRSSSSPSSSFSFPSPTPPSIFFYTYGVCFLPRDRDWREHQDTPINKPPTFQLPQRCDKNDHVFLFFLPNKANRIFHFFFFNILIDDFLKERIVRIGDWTTLNSCFLTDKYVNYMYIKEYNYIQINSINNTKSKRNNREELINDNVMLLILPSFLKFPLSKRYG